MYGMFRCILKHQQVAVYTSRTAKCVREERFPHAEAGCAQTWGFTQSCDPALLLLVSYVIPISTMCFAIATDLNMVIGASYKDKDI